MMRAWLGQVMAVFRLEIRKSFLSRRGLWFYLLAALPLVPIGGHALSEKSEAAQRAAYADPGFTPEKFDSIREGMSREELMGILPANQDRRVVTRGSRRHETIRWSDGKIGYQVNLRNGTVVHKRRDEGCDFGEDIRIFTSIFQFFYLRLGIFFGCVFVFMNLFRGELLDKSLHYFFLAPVRREIVVVGKFLAGLAATVTVFGLSTVLQLAVYYSHFSEPVLASYLSADGWRHAAAYVGVTALACLGYGSVFLASGVLLRNPLIPVAGVLLWEGINGLLPTWPRRLSMIYYLRSLCPVEIPITGDVPAPLAMLVLNVDPAGPVVAIGSVLVLALLLVALAARRSRTLEISYAAD